MKLYLFGNGNLCFEDFLKHYYEVLQARVSEPGDAYIVCDFRGADTLVMEYLKHLSARVQVFHMGERPRYAPDKYRTKVSQWELVGGFASDAERDGAAIDACTHFMAHDTNSTAKRMSGTGRNIARCLELGKVRLGAPNAADD